MKTIGVAKFKEQSLALLDRIDAEGLDRYQARQTSCTSHSLRSTRR